MASKGSSALALLTVVLLAVGCGSGQTEATRELLLEANSHLSRSADAIKGLSDFQKNWEALTQGQQGDLAEATSKLRGLLLAAQSSEQEALSELKQAESALLSAKSEPVSKEMKRYLDMKLDALSEQKKGLEQELLVMSLRLDLVSAVEQGATFDQVLPLQQQIDEMEARSRELFLKAGVMHRDANDYYDEKQFGK